MSEKLSKTVSRLPRTPGIYLFRDEKNRILYIGKATSLRDRVRSYFPAKGWSAFGGSRPIERIIGRIARIETRKTDSVLEALILEANLIKKYQPKYNVDLKDGKSFAYFVITKQKFPRVLIMRESDLGKNKEIIRHQFGPYTSKKNMEVALGIIRKIFPFHSGKFETEKGCLDFQIGRCPGPYAEAITRADYLENIRGIRMILEGKKNSLVKKMGKEMYELAKQHEFEKAAELRNKIFALNHIRDVALISNDRPLSQPLSLSKERGGMEGIVRIEAYDISNISGKQAVGSMVVFNNHDSDKSQYRKFKIKTVKQPDDVGMMQEVLLRRFGNAWPASTRGDASSTRGWPKPDLILLDGGVGHLNMGREVLRSLKLDIPMAAVAKGTTRKNNEVISGSAKPDKKIKNILDDNSLVKQIMDEAHRFAIAYHRKLRKKAFI